MAAGTWHNWATSVTSKRSLIAYDHQLHGITHLGRLTEYLTGPDDDTETHDGDNPCATTRRSVHPQAPSSLPLPPCRGSRPGVAPRGIRQGIPARTGGSWWTLMTMRA